MYAARLALAGLMAVILLAVPGVAADLGDAAPPLKVEKWIKGGPVDLESGKGKNIYVVEFWATWCGPCRASIPRMSELQKKYKDQGVIVIGVSIDEDEKRQTRDRVESFVAELNDAMGYAVALDDTAKTTEDAYMDGFMFDGIPTAFVIDKAGKVVWGGQAGDAEGGGVSWAALDKALEEIIADKYDLAAAQKADKQRRVTVEKQRKGRELAAKYFELVTENEKPEGSQKLGKEVVEFFDKDAVMLNDFAWKILTEEGLKFRDLKFALEVAKAAYDACEGKNAYIVDTYARALFDNGKKKEALEYQKKAVELVGDNEALRAELEQALKQYEEAQDK